VISDAGDRPSDVIEWTPRSLWFKVREEYILSPNNLHKSAGYYLWAWVKVWLILIAFKEQTKYTVIMLHKLSTNNISQPTLKVRQ